MDQASGNATVPRHGEHEAFCSRPSADPREPHHGAKALELPAQAEVSFEPTRNLFHFDVEVDSADGGRRRLRPEGRLDEL